MYLTRVVIFDNIPLDDKRLPPAKTRIARSAQLEFGRALTIVAEGRHPDITKRLKGLALGFSSWSCAFAAMHSASSRACR